MRAVRITEFGGPEVLTITEVPDPVPGENELLIDVSRAGVNFADTHQTDDSYLAPAKLPLIPGSEVVGTTADGRRVAAMTGSGGYAEKAVVNKYLAFDVPEGVDDVSAVALLVQGMTAWFLLKKITHFQAGESIVVHAAAGGVGSLAIQLAKSMGAARVIATASTREKRDLAISLGADVALDPATEELDKAIIEANGGKRVDVVLEMTGGRVTNESLKSLAPFGRLAFYGMASREQPKPVTLPALMSHSTTVSGFWLAHAFRTPAALHQAFAELSAEVEAGRLKVLSGGDYAMSDVAKAHEDLRARRTTGKLVIDPGK
ncbi:zinc-binding dehydrogenase [Kibdelosporangium persicum]|uniref:Zn-dependent oxidoreductase, NADPH:quinone reductase n=1 Tax=Kibdelosporangium persicum TaxID=2698649 RepID=A0ABX2FAC1_9PSEU|nr:zinc-binding dehydrogenase [Kibdelosporangium persicum]NRN68335.1 Zn-dependent oxidoreductase, NADPH:quinone reductase [Kibdelosporangium persicum]